MPTSSTDNPRIGLVHPGDGYAMAYDPKTGTTESFGMAKPKHGIISVTPDESRNLPGRYWSLITCGESLHNNHHHVQNAASFAVKRGELDPGYWYFCALRTLGLAQGREAAIESAIASR